MQPWHVVDPGGQLDMVLTPRFDKHSEVDAGEFGSETHQVFGTWSGRLRTDDGLELEFDGTPGLRRGSPPTLVADASVRSHHRSSHP